VKIGACIRCGRALGGPGPYGERCWHRLVGPVAALEATGNAAAAKAAQLLRDGALARLRGHRGRVWRTVSLSGIAVYLTAPEACNCAAGLYGKLCYHRVAVTIMLAA
jgi:hypothetical protein